EALEEFAAGVAVEVAHATPVVAGEPIEIAWSSQGGIHESDAQIYLMVATADAVRFSGHGFVAFPGGVEGPAGIGFARDRMRAVTPLHVAGNPVAGSYRIRPFREGDLMLSWAVVAATPCGEVQLGEPREVSVTVVSRHVELVIQDLYDYSVPAAV